MLSLWRPEITGAPFLDFADMNLNPEDVLVEDMQAGSGRTLLERRLRQNVVVDEFKKYPSAGAPVDNSRSGDFAQY